MPDYLYSDSLHLDCLILLVSLHPVCFNPGLIVKNEPIGPFEYKYTRISTKQPDTRTPSDDVLFIFSFIQPKSGSEAK